MLITRDGEIGGLPAVRARELMRSIRECAVSVGVVGDVLEVSDYEARAVVDRLASKGFLCRVEADSRPRALWKASEASTPSEEAKLELWGTTTAGNALSKARIGKPMPRSDAQALLDGLISRGRRSQ